MVWETFRRVAAGHASLEVLWLVLMGCQPVVVSRRKRG